LLVHHSVHASALQWACRSVCVSAQLKALSLWSAGALLAGQWECVWAERLVHLLDWPRAGVRALLLALRLANWTVLSWAHVWDTW